VIHIQVPTVPPSINHAYENVNFRVGGKVRSKRRLSDAGKAYIETTKACIVMKYPDTLSMFNKDHEYIVLVNFVFQGKDKLYTKTESAASRYKKLDVSNRIKLFEDALVQATGTDDSNNFFVGAMKSWVKDSEYTDIWIYDRTLTPENPVDELITRLARST
jgi:hypothetical protein